MTRPAGLSYHHLMWRWICCGPGLLLAGCLISPDHGLLEREGGIPDQGAAAEASADLPDAGTPDSGGRDVAVDSVTADLELVDGPRPDTGTGSAQLLTVHSGSGSIADAASTATLSISPSLADTTRTLLVFQASSSNANPANANVRCWLNSTSEITCDRFGTVGIVNIQWYAAEFASGVGVQHVEPTCDASGTTTVSIAKVDPSRTFLLYSGRRSGSSQGDDDFETVRLASDTTVEIRKSGAGCDDEARALQVVQMEGATVSRGTTGAMSGTSLNVTGLGTVDPSRTLLLYSYRTAATGVTMCDRMVRGELSSATDIGFSRAAGATGCAATPVDAIAWQRVELPAGVKVQQLQATVAAGSASVEVSLSGTVDLSRTIALAGGQWTDGQGIGEGSFATNDIIGAMVARHELPGTDKLRVTRDNTGGKAVWSSYVVEF